MQLLAAAHRVGKSRCARERKKETHITLYRYMTNVFSSLPVTQRELLNKFINVDTFFGNLHGEIGWETYCNQRYNVPHNEDIATTF